MALAGLSARRMAPFAPVFVSQFRRRPRADRGLAWGRGADVPLADALDDVDELRQDGAHAPRREAALRRGACLGVVAVGLAPGVDGRRPPARGRRCLRGRSAAGQRS